jgi:alpha-N-arabinofuranosidase
MLTRRRFAASALAIPAVVRAQTKALTAKIKIDPDRKISDIDPKIYGNFAEHLGRCIEGGLWEEGSPIFLRTITGWMASDRAISGRSVWKWRGA